MQTEKKTAQKSQLPFIPVQFLWSLHLYTASYIVWQFRTASEFVCFEF